MFQQENVDMQPLLIENWTLSVENWAFSYFPHRYSIAASPNIVFLHHPEHFFFQLLGGFIGR